MPKRNKIKGIVIKVAYPWKPLYVHVPTFLSKLFVGELKKFLGDLSTFEGYNSTPIKDNIILIFHVWQSDEKNFLKAIADLCEKHRFILVDKPTIVKRTYIRKPAPK